MNVLLFAYYYPPHRAIGATRAHHMVRFLTSGGNRVDVLCAPPRAADADETRHPQIAGVRVHRSHLFDQLVTRWNRPRTKPSAAQGAERTPQTLSFPRRALLAARDSYLLPESTTWNWDAFPLGVSAALRTRPDVVVASGRPFASFYSAAAVAALARVPLVLDLRDPWSLFQAEGTLARRVATAQERFLFSRAAAVIFNTRSAREAYCAVEAYSGWRERFFVVPNGVARVPTEEVCRAAVDAMPALRIVHAGSLYGRSLEPVIEAVRTLRAEENLSPDDLAFRHVGPLDRGAIDRRAAADVLQSGHLALEPPTSFGALRASYDWATVTAVIVGSEHGLCVPGKFFEAVALGKPVLVVAPAGHELLRRIEESRGGVGARLDAPGDAAAALRRLRHEVLPAWPSREWLEAAAALDVDVAMAQLERILLQLTAGR